MGKKFQDMTDKEISNELLDRAELVAKSALFGIAGAVIVGLLYIWGAAASAIAGMAVATTVAAGVWSYAKTQQYKLLDALDDRVVKAMTAAAIDASKPEGLVLAVAFNPETGTAPLAAAQAPEAATKVTVTPCP